jgi:hypothetical protein
MHRDGRINTYGGGMNGVWTTRLWYWWIVGKMINVGIIINYQLYAQSDILLIFKRMTD